MWKQWQISSSWALKSVQIVPAAMKLEDGCFLAGKLCQCVKKQRYPFADKGPYSQGYGLYSSHIWTWELDHKEGWRIDAFKLWCWRRLLRVPWRARRSNQSVFFFFFKPVNLKSTLSTHWKDWCWSSNTLATWCEQPTHWKKPLMLGKIEGRRRRE